MTGTVPILLDVDGVLNVQPRYDSIDLLLGRLRPEDVEWPAGTEEHEATTAGGRDVTLRIRPETRELVARLAAVGPIVWCSSWGPVAGEQIAPLVGLPRGLPYVPIPTFIHGDGPDGFPIKAPYVRMWAADHRVRRLVWIDDDLFGAEGYLTRRATPIRTQHVADAITEESETGSWRRQWRQIHDHTPPLERVHAVATNLHVGLTEDHVRRVERLLGS